MSKWEAWRERFNQRRERRLDMREDNETREVRATLNISVDPSWTNRELAGELITIFDESLHEDSNVWVKSVEVDG